MPSLQCQRTEENIITSTPVNSTGVYPQMPIADHRGTQIVYNTGCHWASGGWPVYHSTHGSPLCSQVCRTRLTTVKGVIDFSIFGLRGLPLGQRSPKGEMTWWTHRSTILQNFIALCQPMPEISVTKILRTDKKTVTDISPTRLSACGDITSTCLSACGDNNWCPAYGVNELKKYHSNNLSAQLNNNCKASQTHTGDGLGNASEQIKSHWMDEQLVFQQSKEQ